MLIGYCTNVHAGNDLRTIQQGLAEHAVRVRDRLAGPEEQPVGLWFPHAAALELSRPGRAAEFRDWLRAKGLQTNTLNGFPYGDFHQTRVKHAVYRPTWFDPDRLDYTCRLIEVLAELLPPGAPGSISTLPIAWGSPRPTADELRQSARQLCRVAERLRQLVDQRGIRITLCLEPEPGCLLQRSADVVDFMQDYLFPCGDEQGLRSTIQVCHDICHSAVMFEPQQVAWDTYAAAGIAIGKVQISAALRMDLSCPRTDRETILTSLGRFAEDRYLHQTVVSASGQQTFWDDLPGALAAASDGGGEWRVHFHVPIYLAEIGRLATTQQDIVTFLSILKSQPRDTWPSLEVETYAWNVLPHGLATSDLAAGITEELRWAEAILSP